MDNIDQFVVILDEIRSDFVAYNKHVEKLLSAYENYFHDNVEKEWRDWAKIEVEKYKSDFKQGIDELNNAANLLRRGKKLVLKEVNQMNELLISTANSTASKN